MSISQLRSPSRAADLWDTLVAREGDFELALEWLDRARARLARELERGPR
jgi:hypothetical protein